QLEAHAAAISTRQGTAAAAPLSVKLAGTGSRGGARRDQPTEDQLMLHSVSGVRVSVAGGRTSASRSVGPAEVRRRRSGAVPTYAGCVHHGGPHRLIVPFGHSASP